MNDLQFEEGLQYAEKNFLGSKSHLDTDKSFLKNHFDLKGKKVLDFGCGMGGMTLWMAKEINCEIEGMDIDVNHIKIAKAISEKYHVDNVQFEVRNLLTNPVDTKYDFIMLNDVAEHIPLPILEKILSQLVEKNLKSGGLLFISYPPWEGPYASHLWRIIKVPWIQFLPKKIVHNILVKKNQVLVGRNDLVTEYSELNHLTYKKLINILDKLPVKRVFRRSHSKLNNISFLKNSNLLFFPLNYLVTKELLAFEKQ